MFVPAVGEASWSGVRSGLRYHSWLETVDGVSVENPGQVRDAIAHRQPGESVRYGLEKDGQTYFVDARVMALGPRAWTSVLGIYTFDALVLLILGITVLYMKPSDEAARALFLFSTNLSLYMATSTDIFGPYWFRIPYFFFVNFVPVSVWNLLSRFPVGRVRHAWEGRVLIALAAIAMVHATGSNLAFHRDHAALFRLEAASHALMAVAGLSAIGFFAYFFVKAGSRTVRDRTKIVLLGTLGAFAPPVVVLALVYGWGVSFPFNFLTMLFALFPLSIGYAIAKHDLFDIDRVIKRTLVYATLSAMVFGVYTAAINVVDVAFENMTPVASRVAEGALILTLLLMLSPSRTRIQAVVDRIYDRRRYEHRDVVRSVAESFTRILDLKDLVRRVLVLLDETIQPDRAFVCGTDSSGSLFVHGELTHAAGETPAIEVYPDGRDEPRLEAVGRAFDSRSVATSEDDLAGRDDEGAAASLREIGGTIAVPMRLSGSLTGMVVVGGRRAGGYFRGDDVDLLETVADQLAVALDNARSYRTIDALNRNLALKNIALEEANREIRNAQNELVQKERLAAVGEMSGAVAHAIRNPLAGIKAAAQLALLETEEAEAAESVRDVISETDRLNDRIGALLDFSRPFDAERRRVSLSDVARDALRDTRAKAGNHGVELQVNGLDEETIVDVDAVLFEQAALELVSNAIEACPVDGKVCVSVGRDDSARTAWLQVEDNGPGLNEHARARLFELFYTTKPTGTGFGLATVKKIVDRHGGRIDTERSALLGGALFRISVALIGDSS
jgi:signal transduction histidine kinase